MGELFAGTPSFTLLKLILSGAAGMHSEMMLVDVECAFVYGAMKRKACCWSHQVAARGAAPRDCVDDLVAVCRGGGRLSAVAEARQVSLDLETA